MPLPGQATRVDGRNRCELAPLAQLAEQQTLNLRVQGSSPWWCTTVTRGNTGLIRQNSNNDQRVPMRKYAVVGGLVLQ